MRRVRGNKPSGQGRGELLTACTYLRRSPGGCRIHRTMVQGRGWRHLSPGHLRRRPIPLSLPVTWRTREKELPPASEILRALARYKFLKLHAHYV